MEYPRMGYRYKPFTKYGVSKQWRSKTSMNGISNFFMEYPRIGYPRMGYRYSMVASRPSNSMKFHEWDIIFSYRTFMIVLQRGPTTLSSCAPVQWIPAQLEPYLTSDRVCFGMSHQQRLPRRHATRPRLLAATPCLPTVSCGALTSLATMGNHNFQSVNHQIFHGFLLQLWFPSKAGLHARPSWRVRFSWA